MKSSSIIAGALITLALGLCTQTPAAGHAVESLPESLSAVLKQQRMSAKGLSIYVREIGSPQPVLAFGADTPRNPASTMKLLTTLVALERLGPAYSWKTEAYAGASVRNGHLDGDLYLKGYGDPYLVIEHFWRFLRALRNGGLEVIQGDLVLDQDYFSPAPADPADFDGRPLRAYNVQPNALLVNFQAVNIRFLPEPEAKRLRIVADPLPSQMDVDNRVRLTSDGCRGWSRALGMQVRRLPLRDQIIFTGSYDADCGENEIFRVVTEPAQYIHGIFKSIWSELGGRFDGGVRTGSVPADAALVHTGYSPPLSDIVRSVNKYSNNVMTRQLLLTLGAEGDAPPGTEEKGIKVVRAWLAENHLDFPELVLENGAGLSREERISARHLGELLLTAYYSPTMPEFFSSLPVLAMDGTLRRRLGDSEFAGRAHLKTGSLDDVRAQAGILLDRQGRRMVVVSLQNARHADGYAGEAVQNALLRWVYERP
jgi:D-alanyl-D-alanine carboxypeptidase/D-alanyl-D-alanine-endopeptidase (penicillin-binding protein 4)